MPATKGLLGNSLEDSFRVSFDREQYSWSEDERRWKKTGQIVKVFGWFPSPIIFFQNMGINGAGNWGYEYHTVGRPCKFPIDFDRTVVVPNAEALAMTEDLAHHAICRLVQELRAGLMRLLGVDRLAIYVWKGSRFKKAEAYSEHTEFKISYHLVANIHAVSIVNFAHLVRNIWPNVFLVGEGIDAKDAVDMNIYTEGRQLRAPGCAKQGAHGEPQVPFGLITRNPYGPVDDLSRTVLSDPDFKATMRSLITVVDADNSTLLDTERLDMCLMKTETTPVVGNKRKRDMGEHTGSERSSLGRAPRRAMFEQQHGSDAAFPPGNVDRVASVLVSTHPRVGSEYAAFIRQLFVIRDEVGCDADVVSIVVERARISRVRGRFKGADAVEGCFCGLQIRESGNNVTMGSLMRWAKENPALAFKAVENSNSLLEPVEGVGASKIWQSKVQEMLRWVDTLAVSWMWLVQCVAYLLHNAELQMHSWIQQYYPHVSNEDFKNVWCFQRRSGYYEKALKNYVLRELEDLYAAHGKRARKDGDQDTGGARRNPQPEVRPGSSALESHRGEEDGRGEGYTVAGASSTNGHDTVKQDSLFWTQQDASSSRGAEPVCPEDASIRGDAMDCEKTVYESARVLCQKERASALKEVDWGNAECESVVPECSQAAQESDPMMCQNEGMSLPARLKIDGEKAECESVVLGEPGTETHGSDAVFSTGFVPDTAPPCSAPEPLNPISPGPAATAAAVTSPAVGAAACHFENLSKDNLKKVTRRIHVKHLHAGLIDPDADGYFQSPFKTGKSTMVLAYIMLLAKPFQQIRGADMFTDCDGVMHEHTKVKYPSILSIVNLRSLKDGFMEKFAGCDVLSYENKKKFYTEFTPGRSAVITLDSLWMLEQVDFRAEDYIIFLDEIHSVLVYLARSPTLSAERARIWALLVRILRNCKQILATDNDITDTEIDFLLNTIGRQKRYEFCINSYKSYAGVRATEIPTMTGMLTEMYRHLCDGENFTACFNERKQAEQVVEELKARCEKDGMDTERFRLFTSKEGVRITDIDAQWDGCCVFYSPVIVSGRDYNPDMAITTFSFTRGTHTLSPEESVQQLARNRNMKQLFFHLENVAAVTPRFKTEDDIKTCFRRERVAMKGMRAYHEVCNKQVSACGDACEIGDNVFTEVVCQVELRRHLMESSFKHHFTRILEQTGFQVELSNEATVGFSAKKTQVLDENIREERDRKIEALTVKLGTGLPASDAVPTADVFETEARRHAEALHLPLEERLLRDYKAEVFDDKPFQQHLNFRRLALSKAASSKWFNGVSTGDFSLNAFQTPAARVDIVRDILRKCCPRCISIWDLQLSLDPDEKVPVPEGVLESWKVLNRGDKDFPRDMNELIKSVLKTGKLLFGKEYLVKNGRKVRRGDRRPTITDYTVNHEWRDRQIELFRYSAQSQKDQLDGKLANRYNLFSAPVSSGPQKDFGDGGCGPDPRSKHASPSFDTRSTPGTVVEQTGLPKQIELARQARVNGWWKCSDFEAQTGPKFKTPRPLFSKAVLTGAARK